jgi:tetratricopeptide (TPR) repeat protein
MPANLPAKQKARTEKKARKRRADGGEFDAERRGLSIFLRQTSEFRLALALYNDVLVRDATVRSISDELAREGIRVLTLDLREPAGERTLLARVESLVNEVELSARRRVVVMVINLEGCVDYAPELAQPGGPGVAFLETANLHRELFSRACPGPMVIWMTELLERAFIRYAPDLWHWRSHVFDLRTRHKPAGEMATVESPPMRNDDERLHPEVRLRRLEEELAAYRKTESRFDEARVLDAIGRARLHGGDARVAQRDFEAAGEIFREIGDRRGEGAALGNLGLAYADLGEPRKAIEFYEQALVIAREIGDRRGEGSALGNLGLAYATLGEPRKAIEFHEQALVIDREIGDRRGEGADLGNLGNAYMNLGEPRKAIEFYEQHRDIAREIGDRRGEGNALGNLGNAYAALGEPRQAVEFYERQLKIAREIGDRCREGNALFNSALALDKLGDGTQAITRATAALEIYEAIEDPNAAQVRAALAEWRGQG